MMRTITIIMSLIIAFSMQSAAAMPVIIKVSEGHLDEIANSIENAKKIELFNAISADLSYEEIKKLSENPAVLGIYYDVDVKAVDEIQMLSMPDLFSSTATSDGTEDLWNLNFVNVSGVWEMGYTGKGVKVAVIDTGIAPHPDFGNRITGFADFVNGKTEPYDDHGHGTHVAGIVAGSRTGVAPEAEILAVKVLDSRGSGKLSTVLMGIQWAYENGADVVSMSLGALPGIGGSFSRIISSNEVAEIQLPVYSSLGEIYDEMDNFVPSYIKMRINPDTVNYVWAAPPYGGARVLERVVEGPFTLKFDLIGYVNGEFAVKLENNGEVRELLRISSSSYNTWKTFELSSDAGGKLIFESQGDNYIWLDNIAIPEYDFYDDVENGNSGWNASGWFIVLHTLSKEIPEGFDFELISPSGSAVEPYCVVTTSYYDCQYSPSNVLEKGNWTIRLSSSSTKKVEVDVTAYVVYPSNGHDLLSEAVNEIVSRGIVTVVAAGNSGELGERSIASPGSAEKAITVGAADKNGKVAYFSSMGPVGYEKEYIKPDVVAPGVSVVSTWRDGSYASLSGTSMATPHVSGIAAILLQFNPDTSPNDVKRAIEESATDIEEAGKDVKSGSGLVDAYRALTAAMNIEVKKNQPPVVLFEITPEKPVAGEEVLFKSLSYDPDGKISWVRWDFGDGESRVGPGLLHVYEKPGEYTITITACDDKGLTNSTSTTLRVYEATVTVQGYVKNSVGMAVKAEIVTPDMVVSADDSGYYVVEVEKNATVTVLAEGYEEYTFTAEKDGYYNITLKDITPPKIHLPEIGEYINYTELEINAEVFDNETGVSEVVYYLDGSEVENTVKLSEGLHEIKVRASDYDGNAAEVALSFTVDVTKPEITLIDAEWSSEGYKVTLKTSEEVEITAEGGDCSIQGDGLNWVVLVKSGSTVTLQATDRAGNYETMQIVVPEVNIQLIAPSGLTNTAEMRFILPYEAGYSIYVDGKEVYKGTGSGEIAVNLELSDGEHVWWVRAFGTESEKLSFTLDTKPPEVVSVELDGNTLTVKPSEELKWAKANGIEMQKEGEVWTCSISDSEITITMEDLAGNIGVYEYTEKKIVADFTFTPENPKVGERVTFKAYVEGIEYKQIIWLFSNGRMRMGQTTTMSFSSPGEYTVKMAVLTPDYKIAALVVKEIKVS